MKISDTVKELETKLEMLSTTNEALTSENAALYKKLGLSKKLVSHTIPVKIYHTKSRNNTTVMFKDGSSVTVKKKPGEKDCIDTAVAYAILKHLYPKSLINKLIKEREEK